MILFILSILTLTIHKLEVQSINHILFRYETSNILSQNFLKKIFKFDTYNLQNYIHRNYNSSEFFFLYNTKTNDKIIEERFCIFESDNKPSLLNYNYLLNNNCNLQEIFPRFSINNYDDNLIIIKSYNNKNYSETIWNKQLKTQLNYNKSYTVDILQYILSKNYDFLKFKFKKFPFLYFNSELKNFYDIFQVILNLVENFDNIEFIKLFDALKIFTENYDENVVINRYYFKKGIEITPESIDFFVSCLFTDISNIIGFLINRNQYIFQIYNFIECSENIYCEFVILLKFKFKPERFNYNVYNKPMICLCDSNSKDVLIINTFFCEEDVYIVINRNHCLNNNNEEVKIKFESNGEMYESDYINIRKHNNE